MATAMLARSAVVKMPFFHRWSGSTGSAARRSARTKRTSETAPVAYSPRITGELQGNSPPPQTVARSTVVSPTESVAKPA